eukprot:CAMPEP_0173145496 /NCGR_PEP_ID=MMETSP1105-20130129/7893_1 /TAXON_ID=2985 /ORGANISM="Ochromonas sp., Strain BG-1" /LENGTH=348 /DNA_ID=CAMNT_0014059439 /DNA_START=885 /DNA_END=1930 /DNA_ORIENTATION=+
MNELLEYVQRQNIYQFYDCPDIWQHCKKIIHFQPEDVALRNYLETSQLQSQLLSTLPSTNATSTPAATPGKGKSVKLEKKQTGKTAKKSSDATNTSEASQGFTMMSADKFQFYVKLVGDFLIGMKRLFDAKGQVVIGASPSTTSSTTINQLNQTQKVVRPEVVSGLLLQLGIHHDGFVKGRNAVQDLIILQPNIDVEDSYFTFHQFLQIYFIACNLTALVDYPHLPARSLLPKVFPNVFTGLWEVVDQEYVSKMEKAMVQYAHENPTVFLFLDPKEVPQAINCKASDVISLMMVVGIDLEAQLYRHVIGKLKHFIDTGKPDTFSLQALLAIYCNCVYGESHRKEILLP